MLQKLSAACLVTTGASSPRPAAMHLLRAARTESPVDWILDSRRELREYTALIHPDPVDVISIHYYDDGMEAAGGSLGSPGNLRLFKRIADQIGKPLFVGEIGLHRDIPGLDYRSEEAVALLSRTLPVLVELEIPLTLFWTFNDDRTWNRENPSFKLRYGTSDTVLAMIEDANLHAATGD